MTLKDYIFLLKDRLLLPHGSGAAAKTSDHNDGFHTNSMLKSDIKNALRKVCVDSELFVIEYPLALIADTYEYGYPEQCIKIHHITHTYNDVVSPPLKFQPHTVFLTGFREDYTSPQPSHWTTLQQKQEAHRFWDSTAVAYTTTSTVTTGDNSYLYDEDANFGVLESGEYPEPDDIVWNDTDDSYGQVDYFEMNTAAITGSGTVSGGSATTLTTADSLSAAKEGHLIWDTTSELWGFISSVASDGTITIEGNAWNGQAGTGSPVSGNSYKIGIANKIYFKGLNPFTSVGVQGGSDNTFTAGDTYRLQDKWSKVKTIKFKPVPSASDTTGTESVVVYYTAEPEHMIDDDDPCVVDDVWSECLVDYAYIQALKRQPERLGEIEGLEFAYEAKVDRMKTFLGHRAAGEADNLFDHITPRISGPSMHFEWTVS